MTRAVVKIKKYGGTSVASVEHLRRVAKDLVSEHQRGIPQLVVVSAMAKTTDELMGMALQVTKRPRARELDILLTTGEQVSIALLAMAVHDLGANAIALTGAQCGIVTDRNFAHARIQNIETDKLNRLLDEKYIVIVAGFQGITTDHEITTLGRGGSDTTAVALAAGLGAERCEVYTDVDGIHTADPRLVPEARRLKEIGYEEMLELASYGAKMNPRSIELAMLHDVPVLVANAFGDGEGTLIHGGSKMSMEVRNKVRSIATEADVAKVTVLGVKDRPGIAASLFEPLAEKGISVDVIVQNAGVEGSTDVTFTVAGRDLARSLEVIEPVAQEIGSRGVTSSAKLAKVSIVGTGMLNAPGYASRMFKALYTEGINIEMITTSEIRITCIVAEERIADAARALHRTFELEEP
ncbi:MAG: aspartate kinase [Chloroflexi bacterium]|nr:aspartate kinase [Chloroflexota bacterium]